MRTQRYGAGATAAVVTVVLAALAAGCGGATSPPPTPPRSAAPVATAEVPVRVVAVTSPVDVTLDDGRRVWLPATYWHPSGDVCEDRADVTLARHYLAQGPFAVRAATVSDYAAPPGVPQVELWTRTVSYGDTFAGAVGPYRVASCPAAPASSAPTSTAPSSDGPVDVDVDRDHRESRFCRRHLFC